ncbi:unnamed protein product [[Actinomadura] parvosata subsp. kistnae]|uniref:Polymerase nucleotidyl transferase domain-containing protein n=2 Tax=Nonomuraea TaxID=83681 RepID=A0A1V0A0M3_9ACTN|nr:hypothetical protein BKM31_21770 [Nonomuraea sp. ATCC 55076]SPL89542.1 unnamed protein product [Actinomadura parvosata subsp. kistnae]
MKRVITCRQRVLARLDGLRVGDRKVVTSVEVFGSRAGSTFRGPGPRPDSDLDVLVTMIPEFRGSRNERWIDEIGTDCEAAAGFPIRLHHPPNLPPFRQSVPGAQFRRVL